MFVKSLHMTNWLFRPQKQRFFSAEFLHHNQATGLSLCGPEPSEPVLQRASQDGAAETQSPEFVHYHHQNLLPGKNLCLSALVFWFFGFSSLKIPGSVCLAGPGVFHRWLRGYRYWTQRTSLRRGQASAAARGEMSNTEQMADVVRWSVTSIKIHAKW